MLKKSQCKPVSCEEKQKMRWNMQSSCLFICYCFVVVVVVVVNLEAFTASPAQKERARSEPCKVGKPQLGSTEGGATERVQESETAEIWGVV